MLASALLSGDFFETLSNKKSFACSCNSTKTNPNNNRFFTQPLFLGVGYAAVPPLASYVASFAGWQGVHVFFAILCGLGAFFGALFKPIKVLIYEEDTSNVIGCHERSPPAESSWTDNQQVWVQIAQKIYTGL